MLYNVIKIHKDGKQSVIVCHGTKERAEKARKDYLKFWGENQDIIIEEVK